MKLNLLNFAIFILLMAGFTNRLSAQEMITKKNKPVSEVPVPDSSDRNNNFYDNAPTYALKGSGIEILGEVENPGQVVFSELKKHSVIVKETMLTADGTDKFTGAYRYDGYSLFDILNERFLKKKNAAEFNPIIDLYVVIENDKGDKVIVSWGEIYYPTRLHQIIIATDVARIVPSKTKDLWPLPTEQKLVIGSDLVTERNISNPTKITVVSYGRSIKVDRNIDPIYSPEIQVYAKNKVADRISDISTFQKQTFQTIFYGRGRGIHSTTPFNGVCVKDYFAIHFPVNKSNLKTGMFVFVGNDGYRTVYSYSEVMNRNDQAELLIVNCEKDKESGKFRIFPASDFFSDRAVKAVSDIYFEE